MFSINCGKAVRATAYETSEGNKSLWETFLYGTQGCGNKIQAPFVL